MGTYTNRYANFVDSNNVAMTVPFITLPTKSSDKYAVYTIGKSRLDKMSLSFYGDPYQGWVIMLANPEFSKETDITDGAMLCIPYPLTQTMSDYNDAMNLHIKLYGNQ
jgi:hypothetical protein